MIAAHEISDMGVKAMRGVLLVSFVFVLSCLGFASEGAAQARGFELSLAPSLQLHTLQVAAAVPYTGANADLLALQNERAQIGIGGPIALTIAGGVIAIAGVPYLLWGLIFSNSFDDLDGVSDLSGVYIAIGAVAIGVGGLLAIIGGVTLGGRISRRRELAEQIRELKMRQGIAQFDRSRPQLAQMRAPTLFSVAF